MAMKYMTAGAVVATALMSSVAFAQTPAPATGSAMTATPMAASPTSNAMHQGQWRTSKLIGLNVYNNANEKLGDINELLVDSRGDIQSVVIGVGGFLGMGEHDVAVKFDQLRFVNEPVVANSTTTSTVATRPVGTTPMTSTTTTGSAMTTTNNTVPATTAARNNDHNWYPDHAMLNATKDQLKAMTQFKYN